MCIREFGSRRLQSPSCMVAELDRTRAWTVFGARAMISIGQLNAILHAHTASTEAMMNRVFEGMASRIAANVLLQEEEAMVDSDPVVRFSETSANSAAKREVGQSGLAMRGSSRLWR